MHVVGHLLLTGDWDEALEMMREAPSADDEPAVRGGHRGDRVGRHPRSSEEPGLTVEDVNRVLRRLGSTTTTAPMSRCARSMLQTARSPRASTAITPRALADRTRGVRSARMREPPARRDQVVVPRAPCEAALAVGDLAVAEGLVSTVEGWKPGQISPLMRAMTDRFRARLDSREPGTDARFKSGHRLAPGDRAPFYRACTMLEHGEWLASRSAGRGCRPAPRGGS